MSKIKRIAIFSIILLFSIIILLFPLEAKEKANTSPMLTSTLTLTLGEKELDIDGKLYTIEVPPYYDTHSEVMMPLRVIAESFGFDVKWISSEQEILIKDGYKEIILFIDSNKVLVNNQQFELDYTPCLLPPGRTFVSLQFINEILGAKVSWNKNETEYMITRTKISPSTEKAIETAQSASQKFSSGSFYCFNLVINRDKGVVVWDFFWDNPEEYQIPSSVKSNVIAVANGYTHCLALKASGKVIAWGNNEFGQCNVPSTAKKDVVAIAAGDAYSLALKADGEVVAWGNNQYGQCNVPASAKKDVVAIASDAGGYHSLALTSNGQVIAWGSNGEGRCNVPSTAKKDVVTIAAGVFHSLALKTNGEVVAWGNNHSGQCNVPATAKKDVIAIAAGTHHSLALKANGEVIAWGEYHDKQYNIPAFVNKDIVAINTSGYNSLLLKANGDLIYWRIDDYIVLNIYQELKSGLIKNPAEISLYLGDNSSYINGKFCRMDVLPHIDSNNGLMLPLRVIAEALGADILWLPLDRKIHLKDGNNDVILAIGSDQILVNNVPMKIKCSPIIVNPGRTFVSDEFFSKILDAKVTRNNADTEFLITREHKD